MPKIKDITDILNDNLLSYNRDLANNLALISYYYKLEGDTFRSRAYSVASNNIAEYPYNIFSSKQAREDINGIGDSIEKDIDEYLETGFISRLEELKGQFKQYHGVISKFNSIHGIGPSTAFKLYNKGYRNLKDIWNSNDLTNAQRISLVWMKHLELPIFREEMLIINDTIGELLDPYNLEWIIAGSFRREELQSYDVDLLVKSNNKITLDNIVNILSPILPENTTLAQGEYKYLGIIRLSKEFNGHRIDIQLIEPQNWIASLLHYTGSGKFNILMSQRAKSMNYTLNEYGLYDENGNPFDLQDEEDIFNILNIQYIPPEDRKKTITSL